MRAKKGKCGTTAAIYGCLNRPGGPVTSNGLRHAAGSDEARVGAASPARSLGSAGEQILWSAPGGRVQAMAQYLLCSLLPCRLVVSEREKTKSATLIL